MSAVGKVMISLVGEQPIPNLLPLKDRPPELAVLVHSEKTGTQARCVGALLGGNIRVDYLVGDPYDIEATRAILQEYTARYGWAGTEVTFNLTGGTKSMALAAFQVAQECRAEFLYLQTEGRRSRAYRYGFDDGGSVRLLESRVLPSLVDLVTYIRAHVGGYQERGPSSPPGGTFERAVADALKPWMDEILVGVKIGGALDLDLVVRCENQVGVVEAKAGKIKKEGIDQLNTAAGREYLGTYTQKILVQDRPWDHTTSSLLELARARNIEVVSVPSFAKTGQISTKDAEEMGRKVRGVLIGEGDTSLP